MNWVAHVQIGSAKTAAGRQGVTDIPGLFPVFPLTLFSKWTASTPLREGNQVMGTIHKLPNKGKMTVSIELLNESRRK